MTLAKTRTGEALAQMARVVRLSYAVGELIHAAQLIAQDAERHNQPTKRNDQVLLTVVNDVATVIGWASEKALDALREEPAPMPPIANKIARPKKQVHRG